MGQRAFCTLACQFQNLKSRTYVSLETVPIVYVAEKNYNVLDEFNKDNSCAGKTFLIQYGRPLDEAVQNFELQGGTEYGSGNSD